MRAAASVPAPRATRLRSNARPGCTRTGRPQRAASTSRLILWPDSFVSLWQGPFHFIGDFLTAFGRQVCVDHARQAGRTPNILFVLYPLYHKAACHDCRVTRPQTAQSPALEQPNDGPSEQSGSQGATQFAIDLLGATTGTLPSCRHLMCHEKYRVSRLHLDRWMLRALRCTRNSAFTACTVRSNQYRLGAVKNTTTVLLLSTVYSCLGPRCGSI